MDVTRPNRHVRRTAPGTARVRGFVAGVVLVSGVTTAVAGPPRAAAILPPVPVQPGDLPPVARGAGGDYADSSLSSTPVIRKVSKPPAGSGPAWLTGAAPDLVPASAPAKADIAATLPPLTPPDLTTVSKPATMPAAVKPLGTSAGVTTTPAPVYSTDPAAGMPAPAKPRFLGFLSPRSGGTTTPAEARIPADATAPIRGVTANGAPTLAGPPYGRWYGYGAPTPGANPNAPDGQYPQASAAWLSATGATPGAFPVPVMNPYRPAPGSDPPAYVNTPANPTFVRPAPVAVNVPAGAMVAPGQERPLRAMPVTAMPKLNPMPAPAGNPQLDAAPPGTGYPKPPPGMSVRQIPAPSGLAAGPDAKFPPTPRPVGVPALVPPPTSPPAVPLPTAKLPMLPAAPVATAPLTIPPIPEPELVPPAPAVTPPANFPIAATKPPAEAPAPLPVSVTDDVLWKPNSAATIPPPPGTWIPTTPVLKPVQSEGETPGQPGATNTTRPQLVARSQAPDQERQADPTANLIRAVCQGRAEGVEVRWSGTKKLSVCFEVRTEPEAARLVKDISARPELAPVQIDFCVLVK